MGVVQCAQDCVIVISRYTKLIHVFVNFTERHLLLCCSRDDTLRLIDLRQNSITATFRFGSSFVLPSFVYLLPQEQALIDTTLGSGVVGSNWEWNV